MNVEQITGERKNFRLCRKILCARLTEKESGYYTLEAEGSDVTVSCSDGILSVDGIKRRLGPPVAASGFRKKTSGARFVSRIPGDSEGKIKATYNNGLLNLRFPK